MSQIRRSKRQEDGRTPFQLQKPLGNNGYGEEQT